MPEYCTCGTQLVEGARFCHKCGKPTRDEPQIFVEAPRVVVAPPPLPIAPDLGISFANPAVLRIAFAAAALAILLDTIPLVNFLCILWSMGAGFMTVRMYQRSTGLPISVGGGAKLGWITGVFSIVISTVMVTATVVFSGEKFSEDLRKQIDATWSQSPNYQEILRTLQNPASFATMIVFMLVCFFLLLSLASVAGGALGARFSNKQ
jgi:uncharacterized membrane protein (DUF485 family)